MKCSRCPLYHSWNNESDRGESCGLFGDGWDNDLQYEDKEGCTVGCYVDRHYIENVDRRYLEHLDQEATAYENWMISTEKRMTMGDLISRKAAIEEFEEMVTSVSVYGESAEARYANNARLRFIEKLADIPSVPAVPLDKLCEFLADTLHTPAPCFNNEEICPRMDFGYCRLPDAPDVKECWKKILAKWMEGLDAAD